MHIRSVKVTDVRGFRSVDLDLMRPDGAGCAGWTVVAGRNGAGKTSLLQVIARGLAGGDSAFAIDDTGDDWVRRESERSETTCVLRRSPDDLVAGFSPAGNDDDALYERHWNAWRSAKEFSLRWTWREPPRLGSHRDLPAFEVEGADLDESLVKEHLRSDDVRGWFSAGYGAFRRRFGHDAEVAERLRRSRRAAAFATLFWENQALDECTRWLREIYIQSVEEDSEPLRKLRSNALRILNDGLLEDGVVITRVDRKGLWARQHGEEKRLDSLSSGFRVVAALALDVIAQMHRAFGELRVEECEGRKGGVVVPHSGVVLIDEAEEHLHPAWQQRLGFWFKEHFPQVQFIVTTHSPFVCQAADLLVLLHPDGDAWTASRATATTHAAVVNGTIDDATLSDLFSVHALYTERTEALRAKVAALEVKVLRGEASPDETTQYGELAEQLPANSSSHMEQMLRQLSIGR
jgi:hypothetical protein